MKLVLMALIVGMALMGCSKGSSGGDSPTAPPPGNKPDPEGDAMGSAFACMVIEPVTKIAFVNFGDDAATATQTAVEFCTVRSAAGADCRTNIRCEKREATAAWTCTVKNATTGDVFDAKERSKIEAYSFAHGICSASINGSPLVCSTPETAVCRLN